MKPEDIKKITDKIFTILDHIQISIMEQPQRHDELVLTNLVCSILNSGITPDINEAIDLAKATLNVFRYGAAIDKKKQTN